MAAALFGQLWGEFFLLLLEIVELHLDQLVMFQGVVQSGEELRAQALLADLERGLEALSLGLNPTFDTRPLIRVKTSGFLGF